jgi:hypothetical protein
MKEILELLITVTVNMFIVMVTCYAYLKLPLAIKVKLKSFRLRNLHIYRKLYREIEDLIADISDKSNNNTIPPSKFLEGDITELTERWGNLKFHISKFISSNSAKCEILKMTKVACQEFIINGGNQDLAEDIWVMISEEVA